MTDISRRQFGAVMAAGLVSGRFSPAVGFGVDGRAIPAAEIVDRITRNIGVDWRAETVDTIKAGDPGRMITGVATTAMATLDVLRRTVMNGANLVITSEPTFYSRADSRTPAVRPAPGAPPGTPPQAPPPDPVFTAKNRFIDENNLVVFRLSDHWRARRPDPFAQGLGTTLGWSSYQVAGDPTRYEIPPMTLAEFALEVKQRLGARGGIRVIGERGTIVRRVALLPGTTAITASLAALPSADVVIAGEVREWESAEYARDVVYAGQPKGMILIGRVVSDDPGMGHMARWLAPLVPEVTVRHLPVGDPYWRPGT